MKRIFSLMLSLLLMIVAFAGCGNTSGEVVRVFQWAEYMDRETVTLFEQETGIKVIFEEYDTNEDMFAKFRANPSAYDVICPSDYMMSRLINEGFLDKIDYSRVPNYVENERDVMNNEELFPFKEYGVPYALPTTGILYNTEMVDEPIDSWGALFDPKYSGQVFMIDGMRDCIDVALTYLGYDVNTESPQEIEEAKNLLIDQKKNILLAYGNFDIRDKMAAGEGAVALYYGGESNWAIGDNEALDYVLPKEGGIICADSFAMPTAGKNKDNAYKFIDFMNRPEIAAMNVDFNQYPTPNQGALDLLPDEYRENHVSNPSAEDFANATNNGYNPKTEKLAEQAWTDVKAAR